MSDKYLKVEILVVAKNFDGLTEGVEHALNMLKLKSPSDRGEIENADGSFCYHVDYAVREIGDRQAKELTGYQDE